MLDSVVLVLVLLDSSCCVCVVDFWLLFDFKFSNWLIVSFTRQSLCQLWMFIFLYHGVRNCFADSDSFGPVVGPNVPVVLPEAGSSVCVVLPVAGLICL